MKTLMLIVLVFLFLGLAVSMPPVYAVTGTGTGLDDAAGNSIVTALIAFATGGWGKALFFCALLTGIICLLFTKHKLFGLVALVFGILLGVYGGLGNSLWTLFTGWGSGGTQ